MSSSSGLAIVLLTVMNSVVCAQTQRPCLAPLALEQLKTIYLRCDQAASRAVLDGGTAAHCSLVAEELRERGFDGSFSRMLAWWHVARLTAPSDPASRAAPGHASSEKQAP